jgi:hypothetical protein
VETKKKFASWEATLATFDDDCLDSLLQKTVMIIPKKRSVKQGNAFENTAF